MLAALEGKHGGDVDNFSAGPLPAVYLSHRLAKKEHGLQVQVQHVVPIFFGKREHVVAPDDAGVVEQDIQRAERFPAFRDDPPVLLKIHHIGTHRAKAGALRLHHGARFFSIGNIDAHDIRARRRQPYCHGLSQPCAAASNQRGFSL